MAIAKLRGIRSVLEWEIKTELWWDMSWTMNLDIKFLDIKILLFSNNLIQAIEIQESETTLLRVNLMAAFNSLAPGRCGSNFHCMILKHISVIDIWMISSCGTPSSECYKSWTVNIGLKVMAWCCQVVSHYLSQCWPGSVLPYGITRLG